MNKTHLTAIKRKGPSRPLQFLAANKINPLQEVLDFGCGRGGDWRWLHFNGYPAYRFDPHWYPDSAALNKKYDVVLCTYVLNVLQTEERDEVIEQLKSLVMPGGKIYITVRRDFARPYATTRGTCQYVVRLPYPKVKENSQYCIYELKGE